MRVVLDTNVVVSALLWGGTPQRLIQAAPKLAQLNFSPAEVVARYREIAEIVEPAPLETATLRDPDDAAVLACALAARAEAIVTGDADLHALGRYQGMPILSAAAALALIPKP